MSQRQIQLLTVARMFSLNFQEHYPDIDLEVIVGADRLDLMQHGADVAIRPTTNPPEHWVGKNLTPVSFAPYVHENYWKKVKDLPKDKHRWIGLSNNLHHSPMHKVTKNMKPINAPITTTSSLMYAYILAKNAFGISALPCYLAKQDKALIQLTPPDEALNWDIWLLSHPDLRRSAKIHAFFKFAAGEIKQALCY